MLWMRSAVRDAAALGRTALRSSSRNCSCHLHPLSPSPSSSTSIRSRLPAASTASPLLPQPSSLRRAFHASSPALRSCAGTAPHLRFALFPSHAPAGTRPTLTLSSILPASTATSAPFRHPQLLLTQALRTFSSNTMDQPNAASKRKQPPTSNNADRPSKQVRRPSPPPMENGNKHLGNGVAASAADTPNGYGSPKHDDE